ncbi:MAG TPA: hypothetical protein VGQ46_20855 [Thermoanaerobaculia bacterium]|nr:hypothetical protein [Thermoanaerobaculia bacterium]
MNTRRATALLGGISLLSVIARLLQLQGLHPLVWDEIEFFRATDWVRRGLVPYRDFWEHHTPLQWFLFAPVTALTNSPGVSAILLMRWAQLPLWIIAFVLLRGWMRRAGISVFGAWTAIALVLCSTLFMLPAVEYRVDVLGSVVYIAALFLLQRIGDSPKFAFFGGAMLCLAGFANLRLGPLAVLTLLLVRVVRTRDRAWGGNARANWCFAAAAAAFAAGCAYFASTHSARIAWQRLWSDNFLADRFAVAPVDWMFVHRFAVAFGLRLVDSAPNFQLSAVDPGGIAILVIGGIGVVRALRRGFRAPGDDFFLAFLQVANLLFIAAMKYVFNYHLEIAVLLMAPLVAIEIDRFTTSESRRRGVIALLVIAATVNIAAAVFRGKESDTVYEDFVMREVDRRTPAGAKVFDSVGWPLHRDPAYRYWFLRANVFVMEEHRRFEPYTIADVLRDPPAAVIADYDVRKWLAAHRPFGEFIVTHYLPLWREIWLPGMSARLRPGTAARWVVLADGTYDVYASTNLAAHPWYRQPLDFERPLWRGVGPPTAADRGARVDWFVDGAPTPASATLTLRRGQRLDAISREPLPVGIMLINSRNDVAFCQPPRGTTLEASDPPRWHVPDLGTLAQLARGTDAIAPRSPCRR